MGIQVEPMSGVNERKEPLPLAAPSAASLALIRAMPPQDFTANWLPAPEGKFALMMRAYLPRPDMLDGRFRYPGIERLA